MASDRTGGPELDRFQQFASKYMAPLPVTAPLTGSFGPWVSIAVAAAKMGLALGRVAGGEAVVNLLLEITHIGDSQGGLLASIKKDTTLLRQEALKTAMTHMAEARRVGPEDERFKGFVEGGIQNLYRANSLARSLEEQAVVQFCLGCSYLPLNQSSDARHWFNRSVESEREVLNVLLKKRLGVEVHNDTMEIVDLRANRPAARPARWRKGLIQGLDVGLIFVDNLSLGTAYAARAAADLRIRRQRLEALERFLYFVNTAEVAADEASGRTTSAVLRLEAQKVKDMKGIFRQYNYQWYLKEIPFDRTRLIE